MDFLGVVVVALLSLVLTRSAIIPLVRSRLGLGARDRRLAQDPRGSRGALWASVLERQAATRTPLPLRIMKAHRGMRRGLGH